MQQVVFLAICFVAGFIIVHQLWNAVRDWFKIGAQKRRPLILGSNAAAEVHYRRVLGVGCDADAETLRAAYVSLIEKYDSAKLANLGPEFVDLALNRTKEVLAAYEFLTRSTVARGALDRPR